MNNTAQIGREQIETNGALRDVPLQLRPAEILAFLSFVNSPSPETFKQLIASRRAAAADLLYRVSERDEEKINLATNSKRE